MRPVQRIYKWLKSLGYAFFILFSVATVVFWLFQASFKGAEEMALGQQADAQTREALKKEFGLDQAPFRQYLLFLNDLSPVSRYPKPWNTDLSALTLWENASHILVLKAPWLRRSFISRRPVHQMLGEAFASTFILAMSAMFIATFLGIILGMLAASFRDGWPDRLILFVSTVGISVPSFFSAIVLSWLFGFVLHDYTGLNMNGSLKDIDPFEGDVYVLKNLILPSLALGIRPLSVVVQLSRSSTLEVLGADYIRTARSKGLDAYRIFRHHVLRNALNPVLTSISGWFASLLAGAFFVEYIFNYRGIGKLSIHALENNDLPVVMGSVLLIAGVFVLINFSVDMLYRIIDPRIRS